MNEERYEIRQKIGQGGVGAVYKAFDRNLNREVAIKRVLAEEDFECSDSEDGAAQSLLKEAIALCSVQHPHIVTVFDAGVDEDGPYVVMELLSGKTIDEIDPMSWSEFSETANQTLEALIAAQQLDLVHRDIKPSNVMISVLPSGRYQVKLVDFGLAKFSAKPSLQTIDHGDAVFGSIHFMAPEQFERIPLDKRTDLYSLGCVFYFALTGKFPFDGETAPQVMAAHLSNSYTPLKELRPDIPEWACEWVEWHMAQKMEDRPADAKEALTRFHTFAQSEKQTTAPVHVGTSVASGESGPHPITGPVPAHLEKNCPTTGSVRLLTGATSMTDSQFSPTAVTPVSSGYRTSAPSSAGITRISLQSKKKKLNPALLGLAALVGIGIFVLGIAFTNSGSKGPNQDVRALLTEAADPFTTAVAVQHSDLDSLLKFTSESQSISEKRTAYRALFLAKAIDSTDVDKTIAKFATQEGRLTSDERVRLFEVLQRRDKPSSTSLLLEFISNSQQDEAVIAALDASRNHLSDDGIASLLRLISKSSSQQIREAAEETVGRHFEKKFGNSQKEDKKLSLSQKGSKANLASTR